MKKKELVDKLVSEFETGKVKTLGIYGHGASGKYTFAKELFQALDSEKVNLLETDPYITSRRYLVVPKELPDQKVTACLPVAHELASLERDILALQAGMDVLTIDEPWSQAKSYLVRNRYWLSKGCLWVSYPRNSLTKLSVSTRMKRPN